MKNRDALTHGDFVPRDPSVADMSLAILRQIVGEWRLDAQAQVRAYAQARCPAVPGDVRDAILGALGEISVAEACAALEREQAARG